MTRLSNIADLKVISRQFHAQYQSKPANLREIAKQLGVANILEGSVQKAATRCASMCSWLTRETDSNSGQTPMTARLTDIFGRERDRETHRRVVASEAAGREEQLLATKPTNNPEAYDAYLRGLAFNLKTQTSPPTSSAHRNI